MRKFKKGRKFSRKTDQRRALLKSLASNLFLKGKMKTTEAKAKEISAISEKLITKAKESSPHSKKLLAASLNPKVAKKLTEDLALKFKDRKGGYTRIIRIGQRKSDSAKMAIIELVK